jgi:hypothetical protein
MKTNVVSAQEWEAARQQPLAMNDCQCRDCQRNSGTGDARCTAALTKK